MFIKTPAWVICGLLDAGKTTMINRLLHEELRNEKVLVLQFEAGEEAIQPEDQAEAFFISKRRLEQSGAGLIKEIREKIDAAKASLLLIEWNGMAPFEEFENLFLQFFAKEFLSVEKIVYVAGPGKLQEQLRDGGTVTASQIAASDLAFVRGERGQGKETTAAGYLRRYHRNLPVYTEDRWKRFVAQLFHVRLSPLMRMLTGGTLLVIGVLSLTAMRDFGFPVLRFISTFLGVFLQAVPFLALGVLLSSVIQIYVSADFIERRFPKSLFWGQLFAVIAGFFLPVCDCASIPVFRSLVKKGVPLPAAVTFMLASPVINPVVLLSTWYAFGGNWKMVAARSGLGLLTAFCVGMTCLIRTEKQWEKTRYC
ncbi:MAG: permease [Eubacteriales bacterium]|nr:permease [Eubacteriales bacterium]